MTPPTYLTRSSFAKILVANRGEIACRVMRTARQMGIATVAVYSDADADALHVRVADEAMRIGPAAARESYLAGDRIIEAALASGAEAVHPGYGFLSENADFAEACACAGLVFIGPPPGAIRAMGSKSAAKALMGRAGVPLTPGYHGEEQAPDFLARESARIGYPVLIKASAGGGGKGMRRVDDPADFEAALASCQREARSAFGDDRVLVEKYVLKPRHIEIQVFADTLGNVVYLHERDCSVQRRHQKVLEEAPAPGMTPERRAAMGTAAVEAARAVGYVGAGTVEFIVDQDGAFWFMEMNTRLQVEHPVTEMITGLDLVAWQLRVACGEALPLAQAELRLEGHAIEARIYAENPAKGFLPSTGRLHHLRPPAATAQVRIDTGVEQGDEITPWYDPMIAKLIVWGADRPQALARLRQALADYRIVGVANNVEFLQRLVATRSFTNADLDTSLIERETESLFGNGDSRDLSGESGVPRDVWIVAALGCLTATSTGIAAPAPTSPWNTLDGWRINGSAARRVMLQGGEESCTVRLWPMAGDSAFEVEVNRGDGLGDRVSAAARAEVEAGALRVTIDGHGFVAHVIRHDDAVHVYMAGRSWTLSLIDPLRAVKPSRDEHGAGLRAPMPGKLIALLVAVGAKVVKGTPLLVMEAMKMEHTIVAPADGTVVSFRYDIGDQVNADAELLDFDAATTLQN